MTVLTGLILLTQMAGLVGLTEPALNDELLLSTTSVKSIRSSSQTSQEGFCYA